MDKLLHIYWGGELLPWIRWLTIKSFKQFNPDYKIWLWMPKHPNEKITWRTCELNYTVTGINYLERLKENVDEIKNFNEPDFLKKAHDSQKSDYLVFDALYRYGGIYADLDILFFKPLDYPPNYDLYITYFEDYYSCAGFLIARPQNTILKIFLDNAEQRFKTTPISCYEKLGASYWKHMYQTPADIKNTSVYCLPKNLLFPFTFREVDLIFDRVLPLPSNSIGMHWFAGIAGKWINQYTEKKYRSFHSTFSLLCKEYDI